MYRVFRQDILANVTCWAIHRYAPSIERLGDAIVDSIRHLVHSFLLLVVIAARILRQLPDMHPSNEGFRGYLPSKPGEPCSILVSS